MFKVHMIICSLEEEELESCEQVNLRINRFATPTCVLYPDKPGGASTSLQPEEGQVQVAHF